MLDPRIISVVTWDLDNTLFDRDAAFRRFFQWYLERLGRNTPESGGPALLEAILSLDNGGDGDRLAFCREACALINGRPEHADDLANGIRARLPEFVRPDGATAAALFRLRDHCRHVLVSNGGGPLQRAKLHRAGVPHYFRPEDIFISGEVGFEKPDARMFETVLRALGKRPEQVLHVGDHPTNDIAGAAAVGIQTCWVSRGRTPPPGLCANATVENTWEVASLILENR